MNGLVIILIGIVALAAGYLLYGGWLAKKWGIDPNAKTPAYTHEDGQDYVPSSRFTVFSHQFSSIAGAGPVTGPILASVFGWVPVLLWLIIGGLFIIETLSVMIQVVIFKLTGKRVFLMAPIHHHFEKLGWAETKVVIRFWIVSAAFGALGLALFFQLG